MRWDFGHVYKQIRQAKSISQNEVCHDVISRSTLSRIENNREIPRIDNFYFLLNQIDMSYAEFDYICHYYQPSQRSTIISKFENLIGTTDHQQLKEIIDTCQTYLRSNHDLPIQNILKRCQLLVSIRETGKSNETLTMGKLIWSDLEKRDTWYLNDLYLLNLILPIIPLTVVQTFVEKILERLEVYSDYREIINFRFALLYNLSTLFFNQGDWHTAQNLLTKSYAIAKVTKRIDFIASCQIKLGICQQDPELIEKGVTLLKLGGEDHTVKQFEKIIAKYMKKT